MTWFSSQLLALHILALASLSRGHDIGLSNGDSGRLFIYRNNEAGTVCDDGFGATEVAVACRQLGFIGGSVMDSDAYNYDQETARIPIWLDGVKCTGDETALDECQHGGWGQHNCNHFEDVHLKCDSEDVIQDSCRGRCDEQHEAGKSCYCNHACLRHGDCCEDFAPECAEAAQVTCLHRCGETYEDSNLCHCDVACEQHNNCCPNYDDVCTDSCTGRCHEHYEPGKHCYCNSACLRYDNCCDDFVPECANPDEFTCQRRCDETFDNSHQCHCNDECEQHNNCCPDYQAICRVDVTEQSDTATTAGLLPTTPTTTAGQTTTAPDQIITTRVQTTTTSGQITTTAGQTTTTPGHTSHTTTTSGQTTTTPGHTTTTAGQPTNSSVQQTSTESVTTEAEDPPYAYMLDLVLPGETRAGALLVMYKGHVGYVCDDGFDDAEATVACRELGHRFGERLNLESFDPALLCPEAPIHLEHVSCTGDERTLAECSYVGSDEGDCTYYNAAIIKCR